MMQRIFNVLIALDQLFYVLITLGYGSPDETASAAAYRTEKAGRIMGKFFRPIIDKVFFFQPQHCYQAYLAECDQSYVLQEYRILKPVDLIDIKLVP